MATAPPKSRSRTPAPERKSLALKDAQAEELVFLAREPAREDSKTKTAFLFFDRKASKSVPVVLSNTTVAKFAWLGALKRGDMALVREVRKASDYEYVPLRQAYDDPDWVVAQWRQARAVRDLQDWLKTEIRAEVTGRGANTAERLARGRSGNDDKPDVRVTLVGAPHAPPIHLEVSGSTHHPHNRFFVQTRKLEWALRNPDKLALFALAYDNTTDLKCELVLPTLELLARKGELARRHATVIRKGVKENMTVFRNDVREDMEHHMNVMFWSSQFFERLYKRLNLDYGERARLARTHPPKAETWRALLPPAEVLAQARREIARQQREANELAGRPASKRGRAAGSLGL